MLQKKRLKICILLSIATVLFAIFFCFSPQKKNEVFADDQNLESICYDDVFEEENDVTFQASGVPTYEKYQKGMKTVNVILNFVNYEGDSTNHISKTEIEQIVNDFKVDTNFYFERMSQGFVTINFDYFCTIAPESYEYYKSLDSAYNSEINIFNTSVSDMLDYDGTKKSCEFDTYNLRINVFAGNSGPWNTFLWPHAYSGSALILMMQYKSGSYISSSTLCHELMHTFGVGDLYAYTGNSQSFSAQGLDMMATSSKNNSTNAYYRNKAGWLESSTYGDETTTPIEEIVGYKDVTLQLYNNTTSDYSKTIAYKFGENQDNDEFFVMEYRIRSFEDAWDRSIGSSAVVIYRVNPNAYGNRNGNSGGQCEVIFMGDTSIDISSYSYTKTCLLTAGSTYGDVGEGSTTALVYSGGKGKENLFNGINSEIIVKIQSITDEYATVTIDFWDSDKILIDMADTKWNYSEPFVYNGTNRVVELINLPQNVTAQYTGANTGINVKTYTVSVQLVYDDTKYIIVNDKFEETLTWEIVRQEIDIQIHDKQSVYGDPFKELTYTITRGALHDADAIKLQKVIGSDVGEYNIFGVCNNKNYKLKYVRGKYTIYPRDICIKLEDQTYKENDFEKINQKKYHITGGDGVLEDDDLGLIIYCKDSFNGEVGQYVLSAKSDNTNYNIIVQNATLSITKSKEKTLSSHDMLVITIVFVSIASGALITFGVVFYFIKRKSYYKF